MPEYGADDLDFVAQGLGVEKDVWTTPKSGPLSFANKDRLVRLIRTRLNSILDDVDVSFLSERSGRYGTKQSQIVVAGVLNFDALNGSLLSDTGRIETLEIENRNLLHLLAQTRRCLDEAEAECDSLQAYKTAHELL